jgi:hypothetical protein
MLAEKARNFLHQKAVDDSVQEVLMQLYFRLCANAKWNTVLDKVCSYTVFSQDFHLGKHVPVFTLPFRQK